MSTTLEGAKQLIAQGPVASQEVIKILGTNGGGFFNANSAHPFENPNALTNFIEMLMIFSIGAALTNLFGRMVGDQRQGWAIFAVMGIMFLVGVAIVYPVESQGNPAFTAFHVDQAPDARLQAGGNMEGKEVRFGIVNSALFTTVTTDTSCGAVNTMHDSLLPIAGAVPLVNMMFGCIIFGGVGSGLYGMLLFVIVSMFVAGLMVGRTPEYLGKKLEAKEVKMAMLAILVLSMSILGFTALAVVLPVGTGAMANAGPHGFTEALYGYASATANNGSAFAGLSADVPFWNTTSGPRDVHRAVHGDHPDAGDRRLVGEEEDRAGLGWHLPDPQPVVRRPGDRRDRHHRWIDLLPGRRRSARSSSRLAMHAGTHLRQAANARLRTSLLRAAKSETGRPPQTKSTRPMNTQTRQRSASSIPDPAILVPAIWQSVVKLDPRVMIRNPVMFVVEIVATLTTIIFVRDLATGGAHLGFTVQIIFWLWLTVVFANFAEAVAEGRGKAQARHAAQGAHRDHGEAADLAQRDTRTVRLPLRQLKQGDIVFVDAGDVIPSDGEVIEGIASVDESAITGESAPVIREIAAAIAPLSPAAPACCRIGSRCASPRRRARTFLDRMIALVEGAERQKTPNEIALNILLAGLTIIFVFAVATIPSFAHLRRRRGDRGDPGGAVRRADPDHDRRAAVGDRHRRHGSAGALQRAGDVGPRGGSRR